MGFGPNNHLWISGWNSKTFYEIGGGRLQEELVPEPTAITLVTIGLIGIGYRRQCSKKAA